MDSYGLVSSALKQGPDVDIYEAGKELFNSIESVTFLDETLDFLLATKGRVPLS
jgi:hypothetical protein